MLELNNKKVWPRKNWCFQIAVLEKTLESPLYSKDINSVNPKGNQCWIFIGRIGAEAESPILWPPDWEKPTHWKRPRCWERLRARGEGGKRWWDDWMASLTQWTWFWANSRREWRTGKSGVLQFMGWQRVGHDLVTERQQRVSLSFCCCSVRDHVWFFVTPCTTACQAYLSFTISISNSIWITYSLSSKW